MPAERRRFRPTGDPVLVPQWTFLLKYLGYAVFGGYVLLYGSPSLDDTTGRAYATAWAWGVIISALASAVTRLFDYERGELLAVLALCSFMLTYIYAIGDRAQTNTGAQAVSVAMIVMFVFPASRFLVLAAKGQPR